MDKKSIAYRTQENRLKEERITTANYFIKHNQFEFEKVSLMEIAFTVCAIINPKKDIYDVNENLLNSVHNGLQKHVELNHRYLAKDIKEQPYFRGSGYEYWVSKDIAKVLFHTLKLNLDKKQEISAGTAGIVMLPDIRQKNKTKRIDDIIKILLKIRAVDQPLRINTQKINEAIDSIYLGWLMAICIMGYKAIAEIDWENPSLDSLANICIIKVNQLATQSGYELTTPKCYDEYDFSTLTIQNHTYSYKLSPELIIEVISKEKEFREYFLMFDEQFQTTSPKKNERKKQITKKPSDAGNECSEIIRLELQNVLKVSPPSVINKKTLWETLIGYVQAGKSQHLIMSGTNVKEKDTSTIWTKEKADYHLEKVIDWYKKKLKYIC